MNNNAIIFSSLMVLALNRVFRYKEWSLNNNMAAKTINLINYFQNLLISHLKFEDIRRSENINFERVRNPIIIIRCIIDDLDKDLVNEFNLKFDDKNEPEVRKEYGMPLLQTIREVVKSRNSKQLPIKLVNKVVGEYDKFNHLCMTTLTDKDSVTLRNRVKRSILNLCDRTHIDFDTIEFDMYDNKFTYNDIHRAIVICRNWNHALFKSIGEIHKYELFEDLNDELKHHSKKIQNVYKYTVSYYETINDTVLVIVNCLESLFNSQCFGNIVLNYMSYLMKVDDYLLELPKALLKDFKVIDRDLTIKLFNGLLLGLSQQFKELYDIITTLQFKQPDSTIMKRYERLKSKIYQLFDCYRDDLHSIYPFLFHSKFEHEVLLEIINHYRPKGLSSYFDELSLFIDSCLLDFTIKDIDTYIPDEYLKMPEDQRNRHVTTQFLVEVMMCKPNCEIKGKKINEYIKKYYGTGSVDSFKDKIFLCTTEDYISGSYRLIDDYIEYVLGKSA